MPSTRWRSISSTDEIKDFECHLRHPIRLSQTKEVYLNISPSILSILKGFAISLSLTLVIELLIAFLLKVRGKAELLIVGLVNVLTNPLVVLIVYFTMFRFPAFRWPVEIALEILVIPAEGLLYRAAKKSGFAFERPFLLALACNACSYGFGPLLNFLRAL